MRTLPYWIAALSILIIIAGCDQGNTEIDSFHQAKRLLTEIYQDHRETFYCACLFGTDRKLYTCADYDPQNESIRSERIEWEHIMAASHFGRTFPEWTKGDRECIDSDGEAYRGRNCARKASYDFRRMEADLYNLVPAVGELNAQRSDYSYGVIPGERREFGRCDFEIEEGRAEPREAIRGDIARTYLYMAAVYPDHVVIGASGEMFEEWNRADPVDDWECERCYRIERVQGNENLVVKEACEEARLWPNWFRRSIDALYPVAVWLSRVLMRIWG